MKVKGQVAGIAIIIIMALVIVGAWYSMRPMTAYSGMPISITIGMEPNQVNSLIIIASDQGFFTEYGLNVTIAGYTSGAAAVEGLLAGNVDIATASEFVAVSKGLSDEPVCTFATIDKFQQIYLIGNKNQGIRNISDTKGKKIGLTINTAAEFYLGRYLSLHGMSMQDVSPVDIKPAQLSDALANGTVDAVVTWQPYVGIIKEQMGNSTVIWPVQSGQMAYCCAICMNNLTVLHPEVIDRFLESLDIAEKFSIDHPDEAKAIVQNYLHYDNAFIAEIWPEHQFSLSLDQSLVTAMEDEGRWIINNNLTIAKTIPDFQENIYMTDLKNIRPESVNMIS